jgi:hypothetical protein
MIEEHIAGDIIAQSVSTGTIIQVYVGPIQTQQTDKKKSLWVGEKEWEGEA